MARYVSLGWGIRKERGGLWTRNAVGGTSVRGERRKRDGRVEWRKWDSHRSKVAAMLMRTKSDPSTLIPEPGSLCVYLGASSGSTVSHLHDHICGAGNHHDGRIIAVDISSRMMRDLVIMCETRPGIIPVLADARHPLSVAQYLQRKSDWLFQDLSMPDQAKSFIESTSKPLTEGGLGIISIKAASERWAPGGDEQHFDESESLINSASHLQIIERIDLRGLEDQHIAIVTRKV